LFKVGNYQGAIASFQNFLKSYPTSGSAPSAQYWVGNSYFAQRDYKAALEAQRKLLATYPNSQKVPDAMLNMASSQTELKDMAGARKTLEDLVAKYPVSGAAELARNASPTAKNNSKLCGSRHYALRKFSFPCKGKPVVSGCQRCLYALPAARYAAAIAIPVMRFTRVIR